MSDAMPDGYVMHLPPPKIHRQPHVLGDATLIPRGISESGYDQKEKPCKNCGAVRVTILSAHVMRAWRTSAAASLVITDIAPACPSSLQVQP